MEQIFAKIYKENLWQNKESVSGRGSTLNWTTNLRKNLSLVLTELNVKTFLDLPCGDFNWGKTFDYGEINYIGGDIVEEIVKENQRKYGNDKTKFLHINLSKDVLPDVDIIMVRDCLMHLSDEDSLKCIDNIKKSKIDYMLISSNPDKIKNSKKSKTSKDLRRQNLEILPYNLGTPIKYIDDSNPHVPSKRLGLWKIHN
jgi:hypothetical protein